MMKKVISFILAFTIGVSFCACSAEKTEQTPVEETSAYNKDSIEFEEPLLLVENTCIRAEVTNFFQEAFQGSDTAEKDKYITLKLQNKTDRQLLVLLDQLSIDLESVDVYRGSTSAEIAPKDHVVKSFRIRINESTPLKDMVDLFQLRGTLSVYWDKLNGDREKLHDASFYVAEAFARNPSSSAETETTELTLGETASTDMAEFTMTDFEIRKELKVNVNNVQIREGKGTVFVPDKGMVYAAPVFTLRNIAKESYQVDRSLNFAVDYNDGYRYIMDDYTCYITHEGGTWERNKIGTSMGQRPELSSLMSDTYQVFVPAVDLIETDTEAPLRIIVTLPASGGSQEFIYRIR